jgi:uncharacterized protein (TIGR02996 family)
MKNDKSGFWKAICAAPDDDTPRLVFADYLDEQGRAARAEFIRAQCEVERLAPDDPRRIDLEVRAAALLHEDRAARVEDLPTWIRRDCVTFRRGFPNGIETNAARIVRNASALASRTVIEDAYVESFSQAQVKEFIKTPLPPRLRLFRNSAGGFAVLRPLLSAMTGLTGLNLYDPCQYDEDTRVTHVAELLALPSVRRLTRMTLFQREDSLAGVRRDVLAALAAAPFENLRELTLYPSVLPSATLTRLLRAPWARGLTALRISHDLGPEQLEVLAGAESLAGLRALGFGVTGPGVARLAAVFDSPHLANVTELTLNGVAAGGAEVLTSSPLAARLRTLSWNVDPFRGMSPREAWAEDERLIRAAGFPNLIRLFYGSLHTAVGAGLERADAIRTLSESRGLPALKHLILSAAVAPAEIDVLVASPWFPRLTAVSVLRHRLGETENERGAAFRALADRHAPRITVLPID